MSSDNKIILDAQQKKVLHCDYIRNVCGSPLMRALGATGIIFLVGIECFHLNAIEKSSLASATGYGLIMVLFVIPLMQRSALSIGKLLSILYALSAGALLLTAWTDDSFLFLSGAHVLQN